MPTKKKTLFFFSEGWICLSKFFRYLKTILGIALIEAGFLLRNCRRHFFQDTYVIKVL